MKVTSVCCFVALLTGSAMAVNPVTRVVGLLKNLQTQAEKDGKKEEDLYEGFVCWAKSVVAQKTASNVEANSRIGSLTTWLADTAANLEKERSDTLTAEITQLEADLAEAKTMRDKENTDYTSAKGEMDQAIAALTSAIATLGVATPAGSALLDVGEGNPVLMAIHSSLTQGAEAAQQQRLRMQQAVKLGERFLDKADAVFLNHLLNADVPKVDWKKVNRKATFKMGYKARSSKIQKVLAGMKTTFSSNLAEATATEGAALITYNKLKVAKDGQLSVAQTALSTGSVAAATLEEALQEGTTEKGSLETQVSNDVAFISQTNTALGTKKTEYKARLVTRADELAAFSKAISILSNDDARDLMKKSFDSQEGLFFLQTSQSTRQTMSIAANIVRNAATKTGNAQLLALAELIKGSDTGIAAVITSVETMIGSLKSSEESDLTTVQDCEADRMTNTRTAATLSRGMDDDTDNMAKLQEEMDTLATEIKGLQAEQKAGEDGLAAAVSQRGKEAAEFADSQADDTQAAATVKSAMDTLTDFYATLPAFVQKATAPKETPGKAAVGEGETWEEGAGYGGKTAEAGGIISMLDMVHADILKDKAKAGTEEDDSITAFGLFKTAADDKIKDLKDLIGIKDGKEGDKALLRGTAKDERALDATALTGAMNTMESLSKNCEFYTENYKMRRANRAVEADGLKKARAILKGGKFSSSLLQKSK